jgi:Caspase domain
MPDSTPAKPDAEKRKQLMVLDGLGKIRVFSVGVSDYGNKSGFSSLKQCTNDAFIVITAFRDVKQLNAHEDHQVPMTSETKDPLPSRGTIIHQLRELAVSCEPDDRLLFFFSGHGHRIDGIDDHFLVPQDVFSADHADG